MSEVDAQRLFAHRIRCVRERHRLASERLQHMAVVDDPATLPSRPRGRVASSSVPASGTRPVVVQSHPQPVAPRAEKAPCRKRGAA